MCRHTTYVSHNFVEIEKGFYQITTDIQSTFTYISLNIVAINVVFSKFSNVYVLFSGRLELIQLADL